MMDKEPVPHNVNRRGFLKVLGGVLGGLGVVVAGVALGVYMPVVHTRIDALIDPVVVSPFNLSELESKHQAIVEGINAKAATQQEIQSIIDNSLPEFKPITNWPNGLSIVYLLPCIDLQNAGKTNVWKGLDFVKPNQAYLTLDYSIENDGTRIGVFIPQGINADTVEIFHDKYSVFEKFDLGDGNYLIVSIVSSEIQFSDLAKSSPLVGMERDTLTSTGLSLSLSEKPTLGTTRHQPEKHGPENTSSEFTVWVWYSGTGCAQIAYPVAQNGNMLFLSPN